MPDRPNVLLLMDDEHRPDVLGYAGDDVVRTPTLDWLAETGTVFTNAYTPAPSCVPARQSMRTGQLPRTWDRFGFEAFETPEYRTLALQLARHGYMTASGGKEHYPGWNQHLGWRKRIGPTPMKQHGIGDSMIPDPAPGAGTKSTGDWKWSNAEEIERAGVGNSRTQVQDRRVTEGVEQFLEEFFAAPYYDRCQPETPLLLKTSLIEPHYPFFAADEERFTYYLNRVDPYVEAPGEFHPKMGNRDRVVAGEDVTEREIRRATAAYYAMVERVDDLFGRVVGALERVGEDPDEWVIVFTSDHGELLGERGVWEKSEFWEPSARVPLVVRYPERFDPGVVSENVSLCDLYATICDLAGVPVPADRDSRSLVGLLEGDSDYWHGEYDNETVSQNVGNGAVSGGVDAEDLMIRRDDLKYCYFGEADDEVLFDLDRDPGETENLIDDPAYAEAVEAFRQRRGELGYGPDADPDYRNAGYR
jgi:choline-sulfatase